MNNDKKKFDGLNPSNFRRAIRKQKQKRKQRRLRNQAARAKMRQNMKNFFTNRLRNGKNVSTRVVNYIFKPEVFAMLLITLATIYSAQDVIFSDD